MPDVLVCQQKNVAIETASVVALLSANRRICGDEGGALKDHSSGGGRGRAPTMTDVAARAGVSRALVSTVFRGVPGAGEGTRKRVLEAATELGYRVDNRARMLRRSRTQLLGVVFQVQDAFQAGLVEALYPCAEAAGYNVLLSAVTADRDEMDAVNALLDDRCEALLLVSTHMSDARLSALSGRAPTVIMCSRVRAAGLDVVRTASGAVVKLAIEHLLSLGHRDIAHVHGAQWRVAADRRHAYTSLMQRHGLAECVRVAPGGVTEVDGLSAAEVVLGWDRLPQAIIAFNDRCAVGLMHGLRSAGVDVPGQISIVGYDDIPMAALPYIDLTTVGQDAHKTAQLAVERAIARLESQDSAGHDVLVPPYLVVRGTTKPPTTTPRGT